MSRWRRPAGPLALLAALGAAVPIHAQSMAELLAAGTQARLNGHSAQATLLLRRALAQDGANADVWVQLGFAELGADDRPAAEAAFARTLQLAPDYQDARYGQALIAFRSEDLPRARTLVDTVLAADPDAADAQTLRASIAEAEAARPPKWRLDLGSALSDLTGGRGDCSERTVSLQYAPHADLAYSAQLLEARRSGETDYKLELRADRTLSERLSVHALGGLGLDADYLSRATIGAGGTFRAAEGTQAVGPLVLTLDLRRADYADGAVVLGAAGFQLYLAEGRMSVGAKWLQTKDDDGMSTNGYLLRLDTALTDRLRVSLSQSDAPEISDAVLIETRTTAIGVAIDLTDRLGLRTDVAFEDRAAFDRRTVGIGLSLRF